MKRVLSLLAAAGIAAAVIAVPSAASAQGNSDMCTNATSYNECSWQGSTYLETKTSGSFTAIVAVAQADGYYLKVSGKSDCYAWNASKVAVDLIACKVVNYETWYFDEVGSNIYAIGNDYTGTELCLTGFGNGKNVAFSECPPDASLTANQKWYWPTII